MSPYSNDAVVLAPLGFTLPLSVAPLVEIDVAAVVVTVGAEHADVVNVRSLPLVVPVPFVATARKW